MERSRRSGCGTIQALVIHRDPLDRTDLGMTSKEPLHPFGPELFGTAGVGQYPLRKATETVMGRSVAQFALEDDPFRQPGFLSLG